MLLEINNTIGYWNTFLGDSAGFSNTEGARNTFIGCNAKGSANLTNASAIGYNAHVDASNSMVLGGLGADAVNVGIGTSAPAYTLDVNGDVAAKKILITADGETKDLLAIITQLQQEVNELKQQLVQPAAPTSEQSFFVKIFPNPNSGWMTFQFNAPESLHDYELLITDGNAREIKREKISSAINSYTIDMSQCTSGTYSYSVCAENGTCKSGKFILTR